MENEHQQVLRQLTRWIEQGEMCWLCTVVKTWGSSPRPVGSLLCCNGQGRVAGSLSGGCIEEDLLAKLQARELATEKPEVLIYGGTPEESDRLGLPCGGQLHVVIEPMPDKSALHPFQQIVARLQARECIERKLDLATGHMTVENTERFRRLQFADATDQSDSGAETQEPTTEDRHLIQSYGPRYRLFLIGAGQVSSYLANMAQALDYQVVVCDPREEVLAQWQVDGVQLVNKMPDDAVRELANDRFTAIIALTHDPRIDDMGLMEALRTDAFFVGALGSTRTSAKRRERLLQLDLTAAEISKLHAPVGLAIGSKTPAEIAISILAQLTSVRAELSTRAIGGIILAAGNSKRFGEDKRGRRLANGKMLLEETIGSAMQSIQRLLVVLRHDDAFGDRLNGLVNDRNIRFYCAPDSDQGMGSSLANAIGQNDDWQAALIMLGDMPYIQQPTFAAILNAYQPDNKSIIVPVTNNIQGHPVLFDRCYFDELSKLKGDTGARSILEAHAGQVIHVAVDDPGILIDIDLPSDIES